MKCKIKSISSFIVFNDLFKALFVVKSNFISPARTIISIISHAIDHVVIQIDMRGREISVQTLAILDRSYQSFLAIILTGPACTRLGEKQVLEQQMKRFSHINCKQ